MPLVTPIAWKVNNVPTAAQLNAFVQGNMNYLQARPAFKFIASVARSYASSTPIIFDSAEFDTDGAAQAAFPTSSFKIPKPGRWCISLMATYALSSANAGMNINIYLGANHYSSYTREVISGYDGANCATTVYAAQGTSLTAMAGVSPGTFNPPATLDGVPGIILSGYRVADS